MWARAECSPARLEEPGCAMDSDWQSENVRIVPHLEDDFGLGDLHGHLTRTVPSKACRFGRVRRMVRRSRG
jgi:hypothetical protein